MEIEHKAYWAIRQINANIDEAGHHIKLQLDELEKLRNDTYENAKLSQAQMEAFYDQYILCKSFKLGQKVFYNSCLHLFSGKLRS